MLRNPAEQSVSYDAEVQCFASIMHCLFTAFLFPKGQGGKFFLPGTWQEDIQVSFTAL